LLLYFDIFDWPVGLQFKLRTAAGVTDVCEEEWCLAHDLLPNQVPALRQRWLASGLIPSNRSSHYNNQLPPGETVTPAQRDMAVAFISSLGQKFGRHHVPPKVDPGTGRLIRYLPRKFTYGSMYQQYCTFVMEEVAAATAAVPSEQQQHQQQALPAAAAAAAAADATQRTVPEASASASAAAAAAASAVIEAAGGLPCDDAAVDVDGLPLKADDCSHEHVAVDGDALAPQGVGATSGTTHDTSINGGIADGSALTSAADLPLCFTAGHGLADLPSSTHGAHAVVYSDADIGCGDYSLGVLLPALSSACGGAGGGEDRDDGNAGQASDDHEDAADVDVDGVVEEPSAKRQRLAVEASQTVSEHMFRTVWAEWCVVLPCFRPYCHSLLPLGAPAACTDVCMVGSLRSCLCGHFLAVFCAAVRLCGPGR
jgi:hypothetical protein